jgi:tetratricopeptide (TPR) repeat protein
MNLESQTNNGSLFGRDISAGTFKNCLICLFLLGLIVRMGFLVEHAHSPSFGVLTLDQKYYDVAARTILSGGDLHQLRGLRPLLYPMFLAALYKIGGAHGIDLAIAAQHFLGVLTGLLVALLGARLFRHRLSGLAGGALYLLAPVPLYFEGELLIEPSYVFLICLGLLLLCQAADATGNKASWLWLLSGALMVLTAQARSNILIFMAVFPLFAVWRWWKSRQSSPLLPLLGLLGGMAMAVPWGFVNELQADHFLIVPSAGGVNLYLGNERSSDGIKVNPDGYIKYNGANEDPGEVWAREQYIAAMRAQGKPPDLNPAVISHYWTHRTIEEIKADPGAWLGLMAKKCWLSLWNAEIPNMKSFAFLQTEFLWLRLLPVRWVVMLMFVPAGVWVAAKWGNRDNLFILLTYAALYSAGNVVFFICDRFRYPVWPAMAVMAGGGLLAFVESLRRHSSRQSICIALGMALMAAISLPDWIGAKLPSCARDYWLRSAAWYEKGRFPEALGDIDRSIELDPHDMTAMHQRGNVLLALNRFDDARQQYEQTLKFTDQDSGIWNNYAIALDGLGRTNDALAAYRRATQCDPPSDSAFFGLAFDLIRLGRFDEAARALDGLGKGPNAIALALRSVITRAQGDAVHADALEKQARALDDATADWAIHHARP